MGINLHDSSYHGLKAISQVEFVVYKDKRRYLVIISHLLGGRRYQITPEKLV